MNVRNKLDETKIEKRAYINGEYVWAESGEVIKKTSSIDGSDLSGIAACDEADVNKAVAAAKKAFESGAWVNKTPEERKNVLLKLADLMEEHREELALLDTYETGRSFKNYYNDSIPKAIECIRYFAEAIDKVYDTAIPARGSEFGVIVRKPLGVVGLITPWNDPMVVDSWKFTPALLMGNSVVIKPAEQSALSLIYLAKLTKEAGIPDGVFNVVSGYGEKAGKALALHMDVRAISFTGSSATGKLMLTYAGQSNMKRVYLECGGKGPYVVTDKCNRVEEAAKVLAANMFYNEGQICSAPSRVIINRKVMDKFVECLKKESEKFVPGNPFESENEVGCVVSKEQFDKVNSYISWAKDNGHEVFQPANKKDNYDNACSIKPTIILNAKNDEKIAREEIFGPVVCIIPVDSTEEAIKVANDTNYGLAGALWTDDLNEAKYLADKIEAGLVHINSYGNDDNSAPFGGIKESGIGKDKSAFVFDEFSYQKTIWMHFGE
ncbi:MAG: aldehyde dehydrogenase family protein [Parasporobacterium sp.]|nr:aldehyde dehydrogenase family protein [Parasporobacterium sp.]